MAKKYEFRFRRDARHASGTSVPHHGLARVKELPEGDYALYAVKYGNTTFSLPAGITVDSRPQAREYGVGILHYIHACAESLAVS